jgi:acyl dehydratase
MSKQQAQSPLDDAPEGEIVSDWVLVDQALISKFGEATLDPDPMHVDPEWAARGPFGATIAFGFLTVSLLTHLMHSAMNNEPVSDLSQGFYLNYGFDRLRLLSPVMVDSRVRGVFRPLGKRVDDKGRVVATFDCRIEIEGASKPALVAEWLTLWVPPEAALG